MESLQKIQTIGDGRCLLSIQGYLIIILTREVVTYHLMKKPAEDHCQQAFFLKNVGMRGFEPPISRPPDAHFNRTKLHPEIFAGCKYKYL